jgi:hypothetical protein
VIVDQADEDVFFFYRLQPASKLGTLDAEYLKDDVFVVSFLASEANITLTTGGNVHQISGPLGVNKKGPSISQQLDRYNGNVTIL